MTPSGPTGYHFSTAKPYSGGATPSGTITKYSSRVKTLTGGLTPSGTLNKNILKSFTGTVVPEGPIAYTTSIEKDFAGLISLSGTLIRYINLCAGTITATGRQITIAKGTAYIQLDTAVITANPETASIQKGVKEVVLNRAISSATGQTTSIILGSPISIRLDMAGLTAKGEVATVKNEYADKLIKLDRALLSAGRRKISINPGTPSETTIYLNCGKIEYIGTFTTPVPGDISVVLDYGLFQWTKPVPKIISYGTKTINLLPGTLISSGGQLSANTIILDDYIILDGLKYTTTHKTWRPALLPTVSSRIILNGSLDATWGPSQYVFSGEIVAPVTPVTPEHGSINDLRTTLAKTSILNLTDYDGSVYQLVLVGSSQERSLSSKWDMPKNIIYVTVQLKGKKL